MTFAWSGPVAVAFLQDAEQLGAGEALNGEQWVTAAKMLQSKGYSKREQDGIDRGKRVSSARVTVNASFLNMVIFSDTLSLCNRELSSPKARSIT